MLEGMYTAAAGMAAQQQRMDALSNDVSNVNTVGYKHVRFGFRDLLYQLDGPSGVRTGAGVAATQLGRGFQQGPLQQTGQPFDLAIVGQGYFQVRTATGTALTRAGNFQPDAAGQLVDANGDRLVPPVQIPRGIDAKSVTISQTGVVSAAGRRIGQIALVTVASPTALNPAGNNLFTVTAGSGPVQRATGARIQQGALEGSDVDMSDTMLDLMDSQHSYAMASKAISVQDQMMQIANGIKQ